MSPYVRTCSITVSYLLAMQKTGVRLPPGALAQTVAAQTLWVEEVRDILALERELRA